MPRITLATTPFRLCPALMMSRSCRGKMSNRVLTWSSISRCWPVTTGTPERPGSSSMALMTGATLIASGRVP